MELIITVVALVLLGFPVWTVIKLHTLKRELKQLQAQVTQLSAPGQAAPAEAEPASTSVPAGQSPHTFRPQHAQPISPSGRPIAPAPAYTQSEPNAFVAWLTEDIFMKLGAVLLLIGFGWFVSYAFINDWIGPVGRISLGVLVGVAIMGAGSWRIKAYRHQGSILLVLGSGIILLTLFAAREMYEFLTPVVALTVMFLSVAYVAFVSVLYKSDRLALAGLVMAGIAPLLTNSPDPSVLGLMSYLLLVVIGTLWVVRLTGSHTLTFASVLLMLLYSLPFLEGSISAVDQQTALWFACVFAALFFVTNTMSIIKIQSDEARKGHIFTAVFTGLYLFLWISLVVAPTLQSLAYVFWMLVFSVGSFAVYTKTVNRTPFFIYGAVTTGLLFAATAAELSGPILTLAFTAEITIILLLAQRTIAQHLSEKMLWLFTLPVVLSLGSFVSSTWNTGFLHGDFVTLVAVGTALGIVGVAYKQTKQATEEKSYWAETLIGIAFLYLLCTIWLVLHAVFLADVATTLSLIIYTVIGLSFFIVGKSTDNRFWQICGGVVLGGVVLRLLLIDVWQMDLVGRIITFFVVGTLLLSTAFIKKGAKAADGTQ